MIVAAAVVGALGYLGYKGYRRMAGRAAAACGGCGGACGGEVDADRETDSSQRKVQETINLLTPITAHDRR